MIHVLNGGYNKWKKEKLPITSKKTNVIKAKYIASEKNEMVKQLKININIEKKEFKLVDGRSIDRFEGKVEEPRKGLKCGSIKNSLCLPFKNVINLDKTFKSKKELQYIFTEAIQDINNNNLVFSCGSGITSCVLALAYFLINNYKPTIYDAHGPNMEKLKNENY